MHGFEFTVPTKIILERKAECRVAECISQYSKRVLIHYGSSHARTSGLLDNVEMQLEEAGIYYEELGGVKPNPRISLAEEGIRICREKNLDFILAIGGGSVIDSAKAIGIGASYKGDVWDFYEGKATVKESLPVGVILTVAGAGSEAAEGSVMTCEVGWLKRSVGSYYIRPVFALLNPMLTCSLNAYQTACGISDAMSHIMEYYFTAERHTAVSDCMCEGVMSALIENGKIAVKEPDNYDARAEIMWAAVIAQMGFLNCGRIGQWAAHEIEHEISAVYDVPHGAGMSVVFPAWLTYVKESLTDRICDFARKVWKITDEENRDELIIKGIEEYKRFLKEIGMPITLDQLNVPDYRIEEMADKAVTGGKLGSMPKLDKIDVIRILELCK